MLTKDQLDDLRSCTVAPAPDDDALFVVNGTWGGAAVTLSIGGDVLLSVWGADSPSHEGRATFSPAQLYELCVALLTVSKLTGEAADEQP